MKNNDTVFGSLKNDEIHGCRSPKNDETCDRRSPKNDEIHGCRSLKNEEIPGSGGLKNDDLPSITYSPTTPRTPRSGDLKNDELPGRYNLDPNKRTEAEKLLARCKERCLYLITETAKTETQLRRKLRAGGKYPDEVIDQAIEFLKVYGYIDDLAYARRLAETYRGAKSRKEIEKKLYERGVSRENIRQCMEELADEGGEDGELEAARRLLYKKCKDPSQLSQDEKRKLYAAMMRRGFSGQVVRRVLAVEEE